MEHLTCSIHRIRDNIVFGVERGVYSCRYCRIGLEVHFLCLTVVDEDCTALELTHMELHVVGLVVLVSMTVDTLTLRLGTDEHIAVYDLLVVIGEVALVYRQFLISHIRGRNQTVRYIRVNLVR